MSGWCLVWMERQNGGAELGLRLWVDEDDLQAPAEQDRPAGHAQVSRGAQKSAAFTLHLGKKPNPNQKRI